MPALAHASRSSTSGRRVSGCELRGGAAPGAMACRALAVSATIRGWRSIAGLRRMVRVASGDSPIFWV